MMKWHIYKIDGQWQAWHDDGYDAGSWISFDFALKFVVDSLNWKPVSLFGIKYVMDQNPPPQWMNLER